MHFKSGSVPSSKSHRLKLHTRVQAMSIRKAVILCCLYHTTKATFQFSMFCGIVTRNYTKDSNPNKTIPRLEIAMHLLKKPLVICLTPIFPGTIAVLASHERRTYWSCIPLNRCYLIGLGLFYEVP